MPPDQDVVTAPVYRLQSAKFPTLFLTVDAQGRLTLKLEDQANPTRQHFRFWRSGKIQNVFLQGNELDEGYLERSQQGDSITLEPEQGNSQHQRWNNKPGPQRERPAGCVDEMHTLLVTPNPQKEILQIEGENQEAQLVEWESYKEWEEVQGNNVQLLDYSWNCFPVTQPG